MQKDFLENSINLKELPKDCPFDLFLIENNEKQIEQICEFLQKTKENLLFINGFKGVGKSTLVDFVSTYLEPECLILRYNCFETTILDDMLLSFFETFRNYTIQGKIVPPRIKTENFSQKINSYFSTIHSPILVVINSYDAILKGNKQDILNFVKHLTSLPNVKIIITSRVFAADDFQDIDCMRSTALALSETIFEKYLRANGIKNIGVLSNEFYKQSKGYFNCVNLAVNIMKLRQYTLVKFLEIFSKSFMPFPEFIYREALALVDPISAHLFRLLTVMRIPIHINLIKSLHLYNEERIFFFVANSILSLNDECLYLQDSFREIIEHQIPENVVIKLHSACIDLYNTQLPLKPLERDLCLSRQTMRNEIEYHAMYLPRKPVLDPKKVQVIEVNPATEIIPPTLTPQEEITTPQEKEETKEEKLDKISFIIEDEEVLEGIADSIKDFVTEKTQTTQFEEQNSSLGLTQLLNQAKQEEQQYNYKHVIMLYQNALTKKDDDNFFKFLPTIYIKLAETYKKLSQWYEALEYYTQAQDFYFNASNTAKVYELKLEIANIYYIIYKHENANYILKELGEKPDLSNTLRIKVNLALARLTDDINIEYEYYKKSLPLVKLNTDKSIVAELYYKFAGVSDEKNNTKTAVTYYKKCIELDSNPQHNKYLSRALANMAELYDEAGSPKHAIKYYAESIKIDEAANNYSGLYYSTAHLAEIYSTIDEKKSFDYLNKAYTYAKKLYDPYYIAESAIALGNSYLKTDITKAYKFFIEAQNSAKHSINKESLDKIQSSLFQIKQKISEEEYKNLQDKYGK